MVTLRSFNNTDANVLQQFKHTTVSIKEIQDMICDWNTLGFHGKYFEMFAVEHNGEIVGTVSLYQHSNSVISIGPEIFPIFQRQGFGKEAMRLSLDLVKSRGYKIVVQQVQRNNMPSIIMHKSLAFETDEQGFGKEAMRLSLDLVKSRGYKIVVQQVQRNNMPSIIMHKSLAFETDDYCYTNRKGKEVLIFLKALF